MFENQIQKLLYIENSVTKESHLIEVEIGLNPQGIDLSGIIRKVIEKPKDHEFYIYHPASDSYHAFHQISVQPYKLSAQYFELYVIMIQHRRIQEQLQLLKIQEDFSQVNEELESNQEWLANKSETKKQRSKERSIKQVIILVAKWRILQTQLFDGKRMNLKQTAQTIGVSKKSLDDYFYQLRVGEHYQFDFKIHEDQKIGILRTFVKKASSGKKKQSSKIKFNKKLKILDEYFDDSEIKGVKQTSDDISKNRKDSNNIKQKSERFNERFFWGDPFDSVGKDSWEDYENRFFDEFKHQDLALQNSLAEYQAPMEKSKNTEQQNMVNLFY